MASARPQPQGVPDRRYEFRPECLSRLPESEVVRLSFLPEEERVEALGAIGVSMDRSPLHFLAASLHLDDLEEKLWALAEEKARAVPPAARA